jgi:hypothetical protein
MRISLTSKDYGGYLIRICLQNSLDKDEGSSFGLTVISDGVEGILMNNIGFQKIIMNLPEIHLEELISCTDFERTVIDEDLKKRNKRLGLFDLKKPNCWIMRHRVKNSSPVAHIDYCGEMVRLKSGTFVGRLGLVGTVVGNQCSVSILKLDDSEIARHTSMSINSLELINVLNLSEIEKNIIEKFYNRKKKFISKNEKLKNDFQEDNKSSGTDFSKNRLKSPNTSRELTPLGLKKVRNPREKQKTDNEEMKNTEFFFENLEGSVEGEESRNNLYWAGGLGIPVVWYGDSTKLPNDPVEVQPIICSDLIHPQDKGNEILEADGNSLDGINTCQCINNRGRYFHDTLGISISEGEGVNDQFSGTLLSASLAVSSTVGHPPPYSASSSSSSKEHSRREPSPTSSSPSEHSLRELSLPTSSCSPHKLFKIPHPPLQPNLKLILRKYLTPLDDDMLKHCKHSLTAAFAGALIDFAGIQIGFIYVCICKHIQINMCYSLIGYCISVAILWHMTNNNICSYHIDYTH